MSCIAIIPARGGSKRLPRKNILPINNHPMVAYPIKTALNSDIFEDVIVSTEDEEIAKISEKYGATVLERPAFIAQDSSTVVEVCDHTLSQDKYKNIKLFCCLYATAIFVTKRDIEMSYNILCNTEKTDYVMGVSCYNYHPVQALKNENGYLRSMWPEYQEQKSQFYPELLVSNGTLYWAKVQSFRKDQTFYGKKLRAYTLKSIDIDTLEDYENAKHTAKNLMLSLT